MNSTKYHNLDIVMSPIKVRQGDIQTADLTIRSNINLNSTARVYTEPSDKFTTKIIPSSSMLEPHGTSFLTIQVRPSIDAEANSTYVIPVLSYIAYRSVFKDSLGNSIGGNGVQLRNLAY